MKPLPVEGFSAQYFIKKYIYTVIYNCNAEGAGEMIEFRQTKRKLFVKLAGEGVTFAASIWVTSPDNARLTDLSGCQFKVFWLRFFHPPPVRPPPEKGSTQGRRGGKFCELFMPDD